LTKFKVFSFFLSLSLVHAGLQIAEAEEGSVFFELQEMRVYQLLILLVVVFTFIAREKEDAPIEDMSLKNTETTKAANMTLRTMWIILDFDPALYGQPCIVIPLFC
jgi:hypothetical protein